MKHLIRVAMVALAVVATYFVFEFTRLVAPQWVAIAAAGSLVLTYVGLAYADVPHSRRHQAQAVAVAAMGIEALYGFLFVLHQQSPQLFAPPLPVVLSVLLAALHGAPFTVLLYFVALLTIHPDDAGGVPTLAEQRDRAILDALAVLVERASPPAHQERQEGTKALIDSAPKVYTCPSCERVLTLGEYGAAKRYGKCRQCREAVRADDEAAEGTGD